MQDLDDDHQSSDEQSDETVQLTVEFSQTFTVTPPREIDAEHARDWFHSVSQKSLRAVLSARKGDYEIIDVETPEGSA